MEIAKNVKGVTLLDHSLTHLIIVVFFTLVGDEEGIQEVVFQLVKFASENIDMTKHQGEHPRMGATDVVPFVPIKDVTMEECIAISKKVAQRINEELQIPIFLYEDSATTKPVRKNLAKIRKGQFEKMPEKRFGRRMATRLWRTQNSSNRWCHSSGCQNAFSCIQCEFGYR